MFYIARLEQRPERYAVLCESREWVQWLSRNIPADLNAGVRVRLNSNLKHLIVGLELKAALINPHRHRGPGDREVLFEPYYQNLILEFCVAAFSVLEGIGTAHWLNQAGRDGSDAPRVDRSEWKPAICDVYDEARLYGLDADIERTLAVRDKLHQDRLGARTAIDWHAFSYEDAFTPSSRAIRTLLQRHNESVPAGTNLADQYG